MDLDAKIFHVFGLITPRSSISELFGQDFASHKLKDPLSNFCTTLEINVLPSIASSNK